MKRIILSEEQEKSLANQINEDISLKKTSKPYTINPDKVLIVKKYLDGGFKRGKVERVGTNGFPETCKIYGMTSSNGDVLKTFDDEKMIDLLIEKFKRMFIDEIERKLFLSQVLNDWYDNKIGTFGTLSVNRL